MATRLFSVAKGASHLKASGVVEAAGSAVTTSAIELTYDRAQSLKKDDILRGIMEIYKFIKNHKALPL